jgi:NAD(P)-dependent dehydrogenase (short-subunit alcohol dehydrogenase family)
MTSAHSSQPLWPGQPASFPGKPTTRLSDQGGCFWHNRQGLSRSTGPLKDVAQAILFLGTEESGYVTGQTLAITGGRF